MTIYFITRHPGACAWVAQEGIAVDQVVEHLNTEMVKPGDVVIGTLPVNLAAEVCTCGARYLHLSMELPCELRGEELNAVQMRDCGARIHEYRVTAIVKE